VFVNNAIGSDRTTNGIYLSYIRNDKTIDRADTSGIRNDTSYVCGHNITICTNTSSTCNEYSIIRIYLTIFWTYDNSIIFGLIITLTYIWIIMYANLYGKYVSSVANNA